MKTFYRSAIQHSWAIWDVFPLNAGKNCIVCVLLCSVLSCDSTCLAPCCECSHRAVITHLTAVWNIHSQVSPTLWVSHMDSLLSPPPALIPCHFIPPAFWNTSLPSQHLATHYIPTQCRVLDSKCQCAALLCYTLCWLSEDDYQNALEMWTDV